MGVIVGIVSDVCFLGGDFLGSETHWIQDS